MLDEFIDLVLDHLPDKKNERRVFSVQYFFITIGLALLLTILSGFLHTRASATINTGVDFIVIGFWGLLGLWYLMLAIRSRHMADAVGIVLVILLTVGTVFILGGTA